MGIAQKNYLLKINHITGTNTVLAREACGPLQHALEFTTTPCQNSPSYSEGVVTQPATHPEIFLHTLSARS